MKLLAVLTVLLSLVGCSRSGPVEFQAPTGPLTVLVEISGPEAGPTRKDCVRLCFRNALTGKQVIEQTPASNAMKWAAVWSDADTFALFSSDVGIVAYDFTHGSITERPASETEKEAARAAYRKKYADSPGM